MGRKSWQFASTLPADKLSQAHNPGINTTERDRAGHSRCRRAPEGRLSPAQAPVRGASPSAARCRPLQ
ncbi:hypothetical protein C1886_10765 [Pseudomonas sp. FW300-N1A1]|nr:hypothetical protein C1886_10765 [Pseudomonas sp. FW300-N1A1]